MPLPRKQWDAIQARHAEAMARHWEWAQSQRQFWDNLDKSWEQQRARFKQFEIHQEQARRESRQRGEALDKRIADLLQQIAGL